MLAIHVCDMTTARCAAVVAQTLKSADHGARAIVDLATFTVEIEPSRATARH